MKSRSRGGPKVADTLERLLNETIDAVESFPRYWKYLVGARMVDLLMEAQRLCMEAYCQPERKEKLAALAGLSAALDAYRRLLRLAGRRQWLKGTRRLAVMVEFMEDVDGQTSAWRRQVAKPEPEGS